MKKEKIYITFCDTHNVWNKILHYAIICDNEKQAMDIAMDINSYACFKNVRFNRSGRFNNKDIKFIDANNYRRVFDGGNSFID